MKVMLIFPPQSTPIQPYLSLPSLTAYLQSKDITVVQRDFNVVAYDKLLTKEHLEKMYERICNNFEDLESKVKLSSFEQKHYDALFAAKASAPLIIERIEIAKQIIRSEQDFYDFTKYTKALKEIYRALKLISAAHFPTKLEFDSFQMRGSTSSREIIAATQDRETNPFIEIFEENFLPEVFNEKPDLIGISIINSSQIIPGLTLASLFKSSNYKAHINVGGSIISRLADILPQRTELFSLYFDSAIIYEGERPLLELVKSISTGNNLKMVPNLIYYDGAKVHVNKTCLPESVNSLPTPCFDGFPLDLYFSAQLVLPLLSARGCYWGKCAFCDHSYIYNNRYESRNSKQVVDDLQSLCEKYKTTYFTFSDEGIAPSAFKALSEEIIERKLDINCGADARFESQFKPELCRKIAKAGFRCLYFGLESGCNRVLSHMKKGTNKQTIIEVCRNFAQAGIWNHLYLFFGFPTETEKEAQETIDFIFSNKHVINSVGSGTFVLGKHSPVRMHPELYGVNKIQIDKDNDFQLWKDYTLSTGLTQEQAKKIHDDFLKQLSEEYNDFRVWGILPREHLLLYLIHYRTNDLSIISEKESTNKEVLTFTDNLEWSQLLPQLKEGIMWSTLSFDIVKIQENMKEDIDAELIRQQTHVVYDINNAKIISITPSAKDILELCDGKTNVNQIALKVAKKYSISVNDAESGCVNFLKELVNRMSIQVIP